MLTGFQVSYLAYKFEFQGQEHNAQGGPNGTEL